MTSNYYIQTDQENINNKDHIYVRITQLHLTDLICGKIEIIVVAALR